jgi:hypothetical protein
MRKWYYPTLRPAIKGAHTSEDGHRSPRSAIAGKFVTNPNFYWEFAKTLLV